MPVVPELEEEAVAEVLTLLIEDYEEKHHPLPRVSPNESLKALMEGGWVEAQGKAASRVLSCTNRAHSIPLLGLAITP